MSRLCHLVCDGCAVQFGRGEYSEPEALRRNAEAAGWLVRTLGRDQCQDCAAATGSMIPFGPTAPFVPPTLTQDWE